MQHYIDKKVHIFWICIGWSPIIIYDYSWEECWSNHLFDYIHLLDGVNQSIGNMDKTSNPHLAWWRSYISTSSLSNPSVTFLPNYTWNIWSQWTVYWCNNKVTVHIYHYLSVLKTSKCQICLIRRTQIAIFIFIFEIKDTCFHLQPHMYRMTAFLVVINRYSYNLELLRLVVTQ